MSVAQTRTHAGNSAAHGELVLSRIFEPTGCDQTIQDLTDFKPTPATVGGWVSSHADPDHVSEHVNYAWRYPRGLQADCNGECNIHRRLAKEGANAVERFPTGPDSIVSGDAPADVAGSLFGPERS